jgi:structural maintenance of chromosomes protein 6
MIRNGSAGPAILTVTLLNEGLDAFKPEKYGNRIRIERRINKAGGGGYSLISAEGKVCNIS